MVSKTSSVRSIRLPNEVWEQLQAQATVRGTTVNALVAQMVGALPLPTIVNTAQVRSEPMLDKAGELLKFAGVALYVDVPIKPKREFNPQPKRGKK